MREIINPHSQEDQQTFCSRNLKKMAMNIITDLLNAINKDNILKAPRENTTLYREKLREHQTYWQKLCLHYEVVQTMVEPLVRNLIYF